MLHKLGVRYLKRQKTGTYLKRDASNWKIFFMFNDVEVFRDQSRSMKMAVSRFRIIESLKVFAGHVREPGQSQVGRVLITCDEALD